jgi:hypothetical protein
MSVENCQQTFRDFLCGFVSNGEGLHPFSVIIGGGKDILIAFTRKGQFPDEVHSQHFPSSSDLYMKE